MKIHPFAQLTAVVWFFATVACFAVGQASIELAALVTIISGIGYLVAKY